jgi:hypothetical protein
MIVQMILSVSSARSHSDRGLPGARTRGRAGRARRPLIPLPDRPIEYPPLEEEEPEPEPEREETEPGLPESPEIVPVPQPAEPEPAVPARW